MNQFTIYNTWSPRSLKVDQFHHGKNVQIHLRSSGTQNEFRTHFGVMTNINKQQDNKSEKVKGRWVLCFFVFLKFSGGSFFLHFCQV